MESFEAPPSLRVMDRLAFSDCRALRDFRVNNEIRELGWFCLWGTAVADPVIPQHVRVTREHLGLDQDPRVLCLPEGLEAVGERWFAGSLVERVTIPSSVRALGKGAFYSCGRLRELVFAPDSRLEEVGEFCFHVCGLTRITIPRSVRDIGSHAFASCYLLAFVRFEEGSALRHVGYGAFQSTRVEDPLYPNAVEEDPRSEGD